MSVEPELETVWSPRLHVLLTLAPSIGSEDHSGSELFVRLFQNENHGTKRDAGMVTAAGNGAVVINCKVQMPSSVRGFSSALTADSL